MSAKITQEEAARRIDRMWHDLQALEAECVELGWRSVAEDVYGARLRISDARECLRGWGVLHKGTGDEK